MPSRANFVLVLFEGEVSAETAYTALQARGYITRWLPGQGLPHGLRITISTEEEVRGLAAALRRAVTDGLDMVEAGDLPIPPRFATLAAARYELQRSVAHFYPTLERTLLPRVDAR